MQTETGDVPMAYLLGRNDTNRRLIADLLRSDGMEVESSGDLKVAAARAESGPAPNLAIVDVDGYPSDVWPVCEGFVRLGVPVVVLTRSRTGEVQDRTLGLGVRVVLEKPLRKANLQAIVRSLVGDAGSGGARGPRGGSGDAADGGAGDDDRADADGDGDDGAGTDRGGDEGIVVRPVGERGTDPPPGPRKIR